jgi:uncharacterized Zn-binding protein involved in type VI secretion
MRRAIVRHGDPTTTGGFVIALSSTMFDDGRRLALHGDEATCENCKGSFKIFGSGTGATENGRATVLYGDPVMCPCGKNKVFVASDLGCFVENGGGSSVSGNAAAAAQSAVAMGASVAIYDERFALQDSNGNPVPDTYYTIRLPSGELRHCTTD